QKRCGRSTFTCFLDPNGCSPRIPVLTRKIPRYLARGSWTGHAERFRIQLPVWTAMRLLKRFEPGSRRARSRDRFAAGAKRRYRTNMKISRLLLAIVFAAAASLLATDELTERLQPALEAITPDGLLAHIKVLASDEFEGRAPGTKGEELSVKYINDQFKKIGLKLGNHDGKYKEEVPLGGLSGQPKESL